MPRIKWSPFDPDDDEAPDVSEFGEDYESGTDGGWSTDPDDVDEYAS